MALRLRRKMKPARLVLIALAAVLASTLLFVLVRGPNKPPDHQAICKSSESAGTPAAQREASCVAACNAGSPPHCVLLADLLAQEAPEGADVGRISSLYDEACKSGRVDACRKLAASFEQDPEQAKAAAALYAKACDGGDSPACTRHGVMLLEGRGGKADLVQATKRFELSCKHHDPEGCSRLGSRFWQILEPKRKQLEAGKGDGFGDSDAFEQLTYQIEEKGLRALQLQEKACDGGYAVACSNAAAAAKTESRDLGYEVEWYTKGCDLGDGRACEAAATIFQGKARDSRVRRAQIDHRKAAVLHERACGKELGSSCLALGQMVLSDRGVAKDRARATALFSRACALRDNEGCVRLAEVSIEGRGQPKDEAGATKAYATACGLGDTPSCKKTAQRYDEGLGVSPDKSGAALFHQRACDLHDIASCATLADRYFKGVGVTKDLAAAAKLYEQACDSDDSTESCLRLARMVEHGQGVAADAERATALYGKACRCGHKRDSDGVVQCKSCLGSGHGRLGRSYRVRPPRIRMGATSVSARLGRPLIRREIRRRFGAFLVCYEAGLRENPNLQGKVTVKFVIGRDGTVSNAADGGSDLPDSSVVSCVTRSFYGLRFPQPEGGIVHVAYPIEFSPDDVP